MELKPDVVFNALHGPFGEDGTIQGILEYLEIPYTHSGVLASALAMDKGQAKTVVASAGVPVAEARIMLRFDIGSEHPIAPPYVVKPVREGSSFGVVIVKEDQSHPPQVLSSSEWRYGDQVMVEHYVAGRELTCGVMGGKALGVTEIVPLGHSFYDYDSKICCWWIQARFAGGNFTENLPKNTTIGTHGASGGRVPWRQPVGLPLRRSLLRGW